MTDEERAALVDAAAKVARRVDGCGAMLFGEHVYCDDQRLEYRCDCNCHEMAEAIFAAIEPAIRADERARVVAEATTDEAVIRASRAYATGWQGDQTYDMRAAIRAALGVTP